MEVYIAYGEGIYICIIWGGGGGREREREKRESWCVYVTEWMF